MKERLRAEGLFERARKRRLPFLPRRIAIVTSPSGAAVHDFIRVLQRRFPNLPVLVVPAKVQGEGAAQEIARAIGRAAGQPRVDVVVVARGGGSAEDLWAFNEEVVARALAACPVPTVSAVGHEVDTTLADLVADVRAPTPTAAAELLARVKEELVAELSAQRARLVRAARGLLEKRGAQLDARRARLADPRRLIGERKLRLDKLAQRLEERTRLALEAREANLRAQRERLDRAHPRAQLHRLQREVARLEEKLTSLSRRRLAEREIALRAGGGAPRRDEPTPRPGARLRGRLRHARPCPARRRAGAAGRRGAGAALPRPARRPGAAERARGAGRHIHGIPYNCAAGPDAAAARVARRIRKLTDPLRARRSLHFVLHAPSVRDPVAEESRTETPPGADPDVGKPAYEEIVARLAQVVERLEGGGLSLEDSIAAFEEGIRLARQGSRKLEEAEKKVELLLENDRVQPFASGEPDPKRR